MTGTKGSIYKGIPESYYQMILREVSGNTDLDPLECWHWPGALDKDGYGHVRHPVKGYMDCSHIVAYEAAYGNSDGIVSIKLQVDHICEVRDCYNYRHLRLLSQELNKSNKGKKFCLHGHEIAVVGRYKGNGRCLGCK